MPATDDLSGSGSGSDSRPGLTSLLRTGRGLMTVQTEFVGEPAELVTIVDFRGRVLKRWTQPLDDADDARSAAAARRWHAQIEAEVRASLAQAAERRARAGRADEPEARASSPSPRQPALRGPGSRSDTDAVSRLFLAGVAAYARRDLDRARAALHACARLLPEDERVRAALLHLDG